MVCLKTLACVSMASSVVKRSRFVTYAAPVTSAAEALAYVAQVQDLRASHNCWAYRLDARTFRHNDDGEPRGTAGAPIYSAITRNGLVNVIVVVTRYFGGIKLGVGGLARAYGGAAIECLQQATTTPFVCTVNARVYVPFNYIAATFHAVARYTRLDAEFKSTGCVITLQLPEEKRKQFELDVRNATKGSACVEFIDQ